MLRQIYGSLFVFLLVSQTLQYTNNYLSPEEIDEELSKKAITFGATVRIMHLQSGSYLHSHDVKYGSGSGQQSVTAVEFNHDYNSLWTLKEGHNSPMKYHMDPIKCEDVIRLEHALTKRNLHTHDIKAPLSGKQEISAFGEDGNGDTGDNWVIECDKLEEGQPVKGDTVFYLQHQETKVYLFTNTEHQYNERNCGDCPIKGQLEISGSSDKNFRTKWTVVSGLFYLSSEKDETQTSHHPDTQQKDDKEEL